MNSDILNRIRKEIEEDQELYLINCRINYSEYVATAQILFPNYYNSLNRLTPLLKITEKSLEFKKSGDLISELKLLEEAVAKGVDTPYPYERISIIYGKLKDYRKSTEICEAWFNSDFWKIPNMSTASLKILNRLKKLRRKFDK